MESKLNQLLAPLEKDERSLMKLDAIFGVSIGGGRDFHRRLTLYVKYCLILI